MIMDIERQIQLLPSGRKFVCTGNATILEAGLNAGLALAYGCSNGNCGECLAKVVSGKIEKTRHHDFNTDNDPGAGNRILMCCNTASTDLVLEALEALDTSEIPQQHITAKVKNIRIVNDNVALLHLKTPRTSRLRFLAGQHVQLGGNDLPLSNHSISSCPCDDMNLHFQVPRLSGDSFSDHVFNSMKKGDPVDVMGPGGNFVLDENSRRALVFIAWRTGFGPIRSLVEHAMSLDFKESIRLIWIAHSKDDRYLDNLCRSWEDALDEFDYIPVDSNAIDGAVDMHEIITKQLNIDLSRLADHDFYVAGSKTLLDSWRAILIGIGLPAEQLTLDQIEHA